MTWVLVVAGVLIVAGAVRFALTRRAPDGVEGFRRQIDALSSDARRPIVGRVNEAAERADTDDKRDVGDGSTGDGAAEDGDSDGT